MKKNSVIIREAKGVLMTEGWTKGRLGGKGRPHCVLGAFALAHGWEPNTFVPDHGYGWDVDEDGIYQHSPAAQAFARCIDRMDHHGIIRWNDGVGQTEEVVMAALEACAKQEEAAGR